MTGNRPFAVPTQPERGDAGVAFILIIPALLFVVLHLINATQHLYERREAWAVASAASRVGAQADPFQVRATSTATIDEAKAEAAIQRYVNDAGYQVVVADIDPSTLLVTIEITKNIDYIFGGLPGALSPTITGKSQTTLRVGVTMEGG